uniref:Uncharacterized protein n=1 Tax=Polytomella parva TaxID=51329 RepID=A0A7S0VFB1_9CHLO|mmetsp:Transcript_5317/g.9886  ORF Transcript_5317/g.9886 Transcript_5317/m.9886 type:complete len:980 (+) Transcript_5317:184-3123(+)|eukprot:CAMPEP_0175047558 /NCGR_PEP_ID=MMETSP0052_2-20121109/5669_1 /TAXON_ID=51329 ORGANISM="Polytomella parva, Strain SAG 63-3" /NCGR_SAMPLE_ID=MMETSP0052_2 /ASSEMBLY_ACC=CAM_ASM_000194 /LENGTH=979 /DNA_ID=CAMNT_0016311461 /DNA_START=176 /DNA_END=3115 /DNA_ORIENTATION=-
MSEATTVEQGQQGIMADLGDLLSSLLSSDDAYRAIKHELTLAASAPDLKPLNTHTPLDTTAHTPTPVTDKLDLDEIFGSLDALEIKNDIDVLVPVPNATDVGDNSSEALLNGAPMRKRLFVKRRRNLGEPKALLADSLPLPSGASTSLEKQANGLLADKDDHNRSTSNGHELGNDQACRVSKRSDVSYPVAVIVPHPHDPVTTARLLTSGFVAFDLAKDGRIDNPYNNNNDDDDGDEDTRENRDRAAVVVQCLDPESAAQALSLDGVLLFCPLEGQYPTRGVWSPLRTRPLFPLAESETERHLMDYYATKQVLKESLGNRTTALPWSTAAINTTITSHKECGILKGGSCECVGGLNSVASLAIQGYKEVQSSTLTHVPGHIKQEIFAAWLGNALELPSETLNKSMGKNSLGKGKKCGISKGNRSGVNHEIEDLKSDDDRERMVKSETKLSISKEAAPRERKEKEKEKEDNGVRSKDNKSTTNQNNDKSKVNNIPLGIQAGMTINEILDCVSSCGKGEWSVSGSAPINFNPSKVVEGHDDEREKVNENHSIKAESINLESIISRKESKMSDPKSKSAGIKAAYAAAFEAKIQAMKATSGEAKEMRVPSLGNEKMEDPLKSEKREAKKKLLSALLTQKLTALRNKKTTVDSSLLSERRSTNPINNHISNGGDNSHSNNGISSSKNYFSNTSISNSTVDECPCGDLNCMNLKPNENMKSQSKNSVRTTRRPVQENYRADKVESNTEFGSMFLPLESLDSNLLKDNSDTKANSFEIKEVLDAKNVDNATSSSLNSTCNINIAQRDKKEGNKAGSKLQGGLAKGFFNAKKKTSNSIKNSTNNTGVNNDVFLLKEAEGRGDEVREGERMVNKEEETVGKKSMEEEVKKGEGESEKKEERKGKEKEKERDEEQTSIPHFASQKRSFMVLSRDDLSSKAIQTWAGAWLPDKNPDLNGNLPWIAKSWQVIGYESMHSSEGFDDRVQGE